MAFTLVAYSQTIDSTALAYVDALADQHVRVELKNIVVPAGMPFLLGAYGVGPNITRVQIEAPSLRRTLLLDMPEIDRGVSVPSSPQTLFNAFYNPLPLDEFEPLRALFAEDGTGATRGTVLVWLGDGPQSPVGGDIYTIRATSTTTLVAFQWTNGALTLTQTLPSGRYQVVGMRAESTGLIAARLVFVGGTWRPGCLGCDTVAKKQHPVFVRGNLGVWGEFAHDQPPTVDFLSSSADTSEVVYLDLIKVA